MRVAFVGKGGVGKSSIAGTFARLLSAQGERVLALDSDPMPGLAFSLGVASVDAGIPDEAVEAYDRDGRRALRLRAGVTASDVIDRYAVRAPDGVHFLQLGKARGPRWNNSAQHVAFQQVINQLPLDGWSVVGDLPGGTRQPFHTWGRYARDVLVVAEPTPASILTGRRLARLAESDSKPAVRVVATKTRGPADGERVAEGTGLPLLGCVPLDPSLSAADRKGQAILDRHSDSPFVGAVRSLVDALRAEEDR